MTSRPSEISPESRETVARFEAWVVAHHAAVYRSAWRITRNGADAEDVAQRVFLHVFEGIARPEWADVADPGPRLRWLAVKTALDLRRGDANRRRREEERAMETNEASSRGPDPERTELLARLRADVARLPDELRVATVLRFQEGLTFAAMAELAGTSEPTMFERVKRALEKLRIGLTQAGHAGALVEIEALLAQPESIESVAVPGKLCAALLALPATGVAGAATAATATTAATTHSAWFAAAAAVVVLVGGGAAALKIVRSGGANAAGDAGATTAVRATNGSPPPSGGAAAATAEPARVVDAPPTLPATPRDDRVRAIEMLHDGLGVPPDAEWNERMVDTAHLRGVVVDDDGRTVPGVRIEANSSTGAPKSFAWNAVAESGADGSFDLRVAAVTEAPQPYLLELDHADLLRRRLSATVTPHATTDLARVELRRNAADRAGEFELTLRMVDPDGRPVPRAIVRMFRKLVARPTGAASEDETPHFVWQVGGVTDERGSLVLRASRLGEKRIEIHARAAGLRDLVLERRVDSAGASEQSIALEAGLTLSGRLVPPSGRDASGALRGAHVDAIALDALALESRGDFGGEPFEAALEADGRFTVRALSPGRYRLRVRGDFSPAWVDGIEAGRADLVLPLKRADDPSDVGLHRAEIHGRVVDERGAPLEVEGEEVDAVALPQDWKADDPRILAEFVPALLGPRIQQTAQMLFDGTIERPTPSSAFHRNDLDAGNYLIVVRASGRAPAVSRVVSLAKDQIARDVVVATAPTK